MKAESHPAPRPTPRARGAAVLRNRWVQWALALVVFVASSWPAVDAWLLRTTDEVWLLDLDVYRQGAQSLVDGRHAYGWLTESPQYLPFTYPPFAALMGLPLLVAPFKVVGWAWVVGQVALLFVGVDVAFRPLLTRFAPYRVVLRGCVAAVLIHLVPVEETVLRYGQVNAIVTTLCLVDLARRTARWWPRGSLTGLAAAVKLTPGVFWVHFALARRWGVLWASLSTAAGVTLVTLLFQPEASAAFWTDALLDPTRLGPNADTANQSMRAVLLRTGLAQGPLLTALWLASVLVVAGLGFALARRLDQRGEQIAVVGTLGMLAVLVSPVAWGHHSYWGIVAIGALLGDGRSRSRLTWAFVILAGWWTDLPWTGDAMLREPGRVPHIWGWLLQQSDCWLALLALVGMWLTSARSNRQEAVVTTANQP